MSIIEREQTQTDVQVDERERRARILEAAALEIEMRGWCQRRLEDDEGHVCMAGAIAYVLGLSHFSEWTRPAEDIFGETSIAWWNDRPGITADQVTFLFRWRAQEIRDGR